MFRKYALKYIDPKNILDEMKWYRILYTAGVEPFNTLYFSPSVIFSGSMIFRSYYHSSG